MKYLKRILAVPFVFGILFITHILFVFKRSWKFIKYGGEFIDYKINERESIKDVYEYVKKIHETTQLKK